MRNSSEQTDFAKNKIQAKPYRAYLSEVTAVMNSNPKCAEINIVGIVF